LCAILRGLCPGRARNDSFGFWVGRAYGRSATPQDLSPVQGFAEAFRVACSPAIAALGPYLRLTKGLLLSPAGLRGGAKSAFG